MCWFEITGSKKGMAFTYCTLVDLQGADFKYGRRDTDNKDNSKSTHNGFVFSVAEAAVHDISIELRNVISRCIGLR